MIAAIRPTVVWFGPAVDTVDTIVQLGVLVPLGAAVYVTSVYGIWLVIGRPSGAERVVLDEVINQARRFGFGGST